MIPKDLIEDYLVDVPIAIGTLSSQMKDQEEGLKGLLT
jgi:hypothetical protein